MPTNNYAVWLKTNELMQKLRIPWIEAHRRAQAIVLLDELKQKIAPRVQSR